MSAQEVRKLQQELDFLQALLQQAETAGSVQRPHPQPPPQAYPAVNYNNRNQHNQYVQPQKPNLQSTQSSHSKVPQKFRKPINCKSQPLNTNHKHYTSNKYKWKSKTIECSPLPKREICLPKKATIAAESNRPPSTFSSNSRSVLLPGSLKAQQSRKRSVLQPKKSAPEETPASNYQWKADKKTVGHRSPSQMSTASKGTAKSPYKWQRKKNMSSTRSHSLSRTSTFSSTPSQSPFSSTPLVSQSKFKHNKLKFSPSPLVVRKPHQAEKSTHKTFIAKSFSSPMFKVIRNVQYRASPSSYRQTSRYRLVKRAVHILSNQKHGHSAQNFSCKQTTGKTPSGSKFKLDRRDNRPTKTVFFRSSRFSLRKSGLSGSRLSSSSKMPMKMYYVRQKYNLLLNSSIKTARRTSITKKRSIKYCIFFNRFGRCHRGDCCPNTHDPKRVAVCTRFLRGTCQITNCRFSHTVVPEKMPTCQHFLRGACLRDNCPYLHVKVSENADVCPAFANGFCPLADKCTKKHIQKQSLTSKKKKRRKSESSCSKRAVVSSKADKSVEIEDKDDIHLPMVDRSLPSFIAIASDSEVSLSATPEALCVSRIRPRLPLI